MPEESTPNLLRDGEVYGARRDELSVACRTRFCVVGDADVGAYE